METLDGAILSTAAPRIADSFAVPSAQISICITAYFLSLAVLIPLSGWTASRFGTRRTYITAIIVFTAASAACASSTSLAELAVLRMLQGAGGAMMVPVGRLVVLRAIDKRDMIRAIAYLTWPALVAPIAAPAIGGLLTTYASWQWIFLINLPLGLAAIAVAARLMPDPDCVDRDRHGLDWPGFVGTAASLAGLVCLAALLGAPLIRWLPVIALSVMAVAVAVITARHMSTTAHPLLDLTILRVRTFRTSHAGGSVFRSVVNAQPFLLPLLFQDQWGWSPAKAGAVVLFLFVGNLAAKPLTTPLLQQFGFRPVLAVSAVSVAICITACGALSSSTPLPLTALVVLLGGVFRSVGFSAYNTMAFADIPQKQMTRANTLAVTLQQSAQGLGVAIGVIALRAGATFTTGTGDYRFAFMILGALLILPAAEALLLPRTAGDALRANRRIGDP